MSEVEVVRSLGVTLKDAAASPAINDFQRSQLLSAYSVTRHLAAEETARSALEADLREELETILADRPEYQPVLAADGALLGEELCRLLETLRRAKDDDSRQTLAAIRGALRHLCDHEVAGLAGSA